MCLKLGWKAMWSIWEVENHVCRMQWVKVNNAIFLPLTVMKCNNFLFMLILISFSEFCPFLCYYIFLLPFHIFSKCIFCPPAPFFIPFHVPASKTDHNCVSWRYSEHCQKVYQSFLPCQKITGKSGRGQARLTWCQGPRLHLPAHHRLQSQRSCSSTRERGETCKAVFSPLFASQPSSVVSERKSGFQRGWWHSRAISICTTLGLQTSPWKSWKVLCCIKPGEALTIPWLDSSAARCNFKCICNPTGLLHPRNLQGYSHLSI